MSDNPHVAHHFKTMRQQVEAGKLGMWLFLATEVLMFSGLFVAYAVYRNLHPEIFIIGAQYLDTFWGAFNTVLLLGSSFTMAWAVRLVQLGKSKAAAICLALTIVGGLGFMVVKYFEYEHKLHIGLGPGSHYAPVESLVAGNPPNDIDPQFAEGELKTARPFFSIYFALTGLHGLHVLIGMGLVSWVLIRTMRRRFSPEYYTPVDLVGLYWHLVDLIWIYLFPLLYLID